MVWKLWGALHVRSLGLKVWGVTTLSTSSLIIVDKVLFHRNIEIRAIVECANHKYMTLTYFLFKCY